MWDARTTLAALGGPTRNPEKSLAQLSRLLRLAFGGLEVPDPHYCGTNIIA
jgi:hypothetical protein